MRYSPGRVNRTECQLLGLPVEQILGRHVSEFVPEEFLIHKCEAVIRVFNRHGNRQNKYKARLKFVMRDRGFEWLREQIEKEYADILAHGGIAWPEMVPEGFGGYQSRPQPLGNGALLPVGWYEDATIEKDYKERPEKDLEQNYEYIFTTGTKSAYLIPKEKRSSFPTIPTEHFKRCFGYARAPFHREHWRKTYADLAEKIVARKRLCKRVG